MSAICSEALEVDMCYAVDSGDQQAGPSDETSASHLFCNFRERERYVSSLLSLILSSLRSFFFPLSATFFLFLSHSLGFHMVSVLFTGKDCSYNLVVCESYRPLAETTMGDLRGLRVEQRRKGRGSRATLEVRRPDNLQKPFT